MKRERGRDEGGDTFHVPRVRDLYHRRVIEIGPGYREVKENERAKRLGGGRGEDGRRRRKVEENEKRRSQMIAETT